MTSVNDLLLDAAIQHQIDLGRYETNIVRRMVAVLNRADARLFAELAAKLETMDSASFSIERLESMLGSVRMINAQAYAQIGQELRQELRDFVDYETSYQRQVLVNVLPVQVHVAAVAAEQVYTAALARPFQGTLLREVLADLEAGKAKKIRQAVAQGFVEGRTTDQIIRDLRGTKARAYADGLMEGTRRDIAAVARTAMGHMAGFVQDRTTEANAHLIKAVVWSATLDSRTSSPCRARDGKLYHPETHKPIGHDLPWGAGPSRFHWGCRSAQAYVLKSNKELGIDVPEVVMQNGTRASMDGQLPAETNYADWLKKQSSARQIEVLGPTRAKLLREGNLPMERMYSQKGKYLTLSELREQDAGVFKRAGL